MDLLEGRTPLARRFQTLQQRRGIGVSVLAAVMRTVRPRFAIVDIGGSWTVGIAALLKSEFRAKPTASVAFGVVGSSASPFATSILLVSPETSEVCTRLAVDQDDVFSSVLRGSDRIIPVFCNVPDPGSVFSRATTLLAISDIHSLFIDSGGGGFDELRQQLHRLRMHARANRQAVAATSIAMLAIAAVGTGYMQSAAAPRYYDLVVNSDLATFSFAGEEHALHEVGPVTGNQAGSLRTLILYSQETTFGATMEVLAALMDAGIDLRSAEIAPNNPSTSD